VELSAQQAVQGEVPYMSVLKSVVNGFFGCILFTRDDVSRCI